MGLPLQKAEVVLEALECAACSIAYAMPSSMVERRRQDGGHFFCPNGHSQHFTESEVARLSKKLEEQMRVATKMAECARMAERSAQKAQAETKRLKRRISAGVCPCCNRTFQNLARHMKSKHPETTP